jgi:hypothetical protein
MYNTLVVLHVMQIFIVKFSPVVVMVIVSVSSIYGHVPHLGTPHFLLPISWDLGLKVKLAFVSIFFKLFDCRWLLISLEFAKAFCILVSVFRMSKVECIILNMSG